MDSCCGRVLVTNNLTNPLVENDSLQKPNDLNYGSSQSKPIASTIPDFSRLSLLNSHGHLSEQLLTVLHEVFNQHSNALWVMNKTCLANYYKACYPGVSDATHYEERAAYVLHKYGTKFSDVQQTLRNAMENAQAANADTSEATTVAIVDTYTPYTRNRRSVDIHAAQQQQQQQSADAEEETKYSAEISMQQILEEKSKLKHHTIRVDADKTVLDATINYTGNEIDGEDNVLSTTKFLLFYRRMCVDKPMMVRLELTGCGYDEFRSGMLMDRTKQLEKIAFNIQQLRNRYNTQVDERQRIENAWSPHKCATSIESFVQDNTEPLDTTANEDPNNLFRKRRPFKFHRACHMCCCCVVAAVRCCEQ